MLNFIKREQLKQLYMALPPGKLAEFATTMAGKLEESRLAYGPLHPDTRALKRELDAINSALMEKLKRC